ncbi:MAG: hypothetical protein ABSC08_05925, partial [Bryobacteraceae bacterium]
MKQALPLFLLSACATLAQPTMILTSARIGDTSTPGTMKYNAQHNTTEWATLRSQGQLGCNDMIAYTSNTPDHLPPIYASMEPDEDGTITNWARVGTDGYDAEGLAAYGRSLSVATCYLTLKDGDVTPSGWSYTLGGISLTPQQYGILAGMQAIKLLNKATPTMAKIAWVTPQSPNHWAGLTWQAVTGVYDGGMSRNIGVGNNFGSIDVFAYNSATSAQTNSGTAVLYFTDTSTYTVGDYLIGLNIPAGTTVQSINTNVSVTMTANATGNIRTGSLITDQPPVSGCPAGQGRVFMGMDGYWPSAHTALVFSNIMGPLGTQMNGNTYYISTYTTTWHGIGSNNYGYYLDVDSGGATPLCAAPAQALDYRGDMTGSAQNYNHDMQHDNGYPTRSFMPMMAILYDWMHPLINQSVATALNSLASLESTAVKNTFTAGGSAWSASTNPWTDSTATTNGNYPQAITTAYPTLQAQSLDAMDAWSRNLFTGWMTQHDSGTFGPTTSNYHWASYAGFGLVGIAAYNDDARGPVWYDYWRNHIHLLIDQPYTARWFGPNGNMMDALRYAGLANFNVALTLAANLTARGDDLINNSAQPFSWILGLEYRKHSIEPNGISMLSRGSIFNSEAIPPCSNCGSAMNLFPIQYLADLENDPLKNKFRSFVQQQLTATGELDPSGYPAIPFLFWDPSATQTSWSDEPTVLGNLANPAGGYGHVFMRSDWTAGGVYASFEARPLIYDWGNGKDFLEGAGSLYLQRGNNVLIGNSAAICLREGPASNTGTGPAMFTAADNCSNNSGVWGNQHARQPVYEIMNTAGNPSTTTSVDSVTLTTNADTPSGAVLPFASTTGVVPGMVAIGTHIPANPYFTSFVLAVTPTTVTINTNVSGDVPASTAIVFATVAAHDGGANASGQWWASPLWRNETYSGPGEFGDGPGVPPICPGPGTPWAPGEAYSVTTGHSTDAFSVTLV